MWVKLKPITSVIEPIVPIEENKDIILETIEVVDESIVNPLMDLEEEFIGED